MAAETMNISLPEPLRSFIDAQVKGGTYGSASEFVRELVRNEQKRQAQESLAAFIQAGVDSGNKGEWTLAQFELLRKKMRSATAARTRK